MDNVQNRYGDPSGQNTLVLSLMLLLISCNGSTERKDSCNDKLLWCHYFPNEFYIYDKTTLLPYTGTCTFTNNFNDDLIIFTCDTGTSVKEIQINEFGDTVAYQSEERGMFVLKGDTLNSEVEPSRRDTTLVQTFLKALANTEYDYLDKEYNDVYGNLKYLDFCSNIEALYGRIHGSEILKMKCERYEDRKKSIFLTAELNCDSTNVAFDLHFRYSEEGDDLNVVFNFHATDQKKLYRYFMDDGNPVGLSGIVRNKSSWTEQAAKNGLTEQAFSNSEYIGLKVWQYSSWDYIESLSLIEGGILYIFNIVYALEGGVLSVKHISKTPQNHTYSPGWH